MLEKLIEARQLLAKSYVKWTTDDGKGGHCAVGAVFECFGYDDNIPLFNLEEKAKEMFPNLANKCGRRLDGFNGTDYFEFAPLAYLNNQVGLPETLSVFDAAIADLRSAESGVK